MKFYFQQFICLLFLFMLLASPSSSFSADEYWNQFRGPDGAGTVEDNPNLPETWSPTKNVSWVQNIPGMGWSSPIVWKNKIFLTAVIKAGEEEQPKKGLYFGGERPKPDEVHEWIVMCLDFETGEIFWKKTAHKSTPSGPRHLKNTYASETPVTDGERVYAYFGNTGLFVYDMEGNLVWDKQWEPVKMRHGWGTAASPVLHKNAIYILNDNDDQSFLEALDKKTGEQIWRVERNEGSNWTTPYIWENNQRTEIVTAGSDRVRSYDLEGNLLWNFRGMSNIAVPTPFAKDGLLYICSGYVGDQLRPLYAIKPGANGDISLQENETQNEFIAWCQKQGGPYMPSPVVYNNLIYVLLDRGLMSCYDAKTGDPIYINKRMGRGLSFTVSPWAYNGKVFCLDEKGVTHIIEAGNEFLVIESNDLGEMCMATPAIVKNSLIVRTLSNVYRICND